MTCWLFSARIDCFLFGSYSKSENSKQSSMTISNFDMCWIWHEGHKNPKMCWDNIGMVTKQDPWNLDLRCWHVIRKAIWRNLEGRNLKILCNILFWIFFKVQNWDSRDSRDSCLKIENITWYFKISNFKISSNSFSYDMPAT